MDLSRVYMLASDHRWQWEEWCDGANVPRARISEVKHLVVDAFLQARGKSDDVEHCGALLLDHKYGGEAVSRARAAGAPVGTPVERAGRFPLEWQDEPFHAGLSGNAFAKVLVRYRPEWTDDARRGQMARLLELQSWCRREALPLLIEIIIMREHEDEREFEEHGRPLLLSSVIRQAYAEDLVPDIWKIEGTRSVNGATIINATIRERQGPRQLILGKRADPSTIARWFDAAARLPSTAGFAIGRSVFWEPGTQFLTGRASAADAVETMTSRYLDLIDEWHRRRRAAGALDGVIQSKA